MRYATIVLVVMTICSCATAPPNETVQPVAEEPAEPEAEPLPKFWIPWAYDGYGTFTALLPVTDLRKSGAPCAWGGSDGPNEWFISEFDDENRQLKRARLGFGEHFRRKWEWEGDLLVSTPFAQISYTDGRMTKIETSTYVPESVCEIEYTDPNRYVLECIDDPKYSEGSDTGGRHVVTWRDDVIILVQDIREFRDDRPPNFRLVTWFRFADGRLRARRMRQFVGKPEDLPAPDSYSSDDALKAVRAIEVPDLDTDELVAIVTNKDDGEYGDIFWLRPHDYCLEWDEVIWTEQDGTEVEYADEDVAPIPPPRAEEDEESDAEADEPAEDTERK